MSFNVVSPLPEKGVVSRAKTTKCVCCHRSWSTAEDICTCSNSTAFISSPE